VVCVGCPAGSDVDASQEQKSLHDAEEHSSNTQSEECSDSVKCVTLSSPSESLEFEVMGTAGRLLDTSNMPVGSCGGYTEVTTAGILSDSRTEPAELVNVGDSWPEEKSTSSERDATSNPAHSSGSPCLTRVSTTIQETEDSSAMEPSQHSCLLTDVKPTCYTKRCWRDRNVRRLSRECSSQSSIRSFFKPASKAQQNETGEHSVKNTVQSVLSRDVTLSENIQVRNSFDRNVDSSGSGSLMTHTNKDVITESSNFSRKTRKCPFYKWISGKLSYSSGVRCCSSVLHAVYYVKCCECHVARSCSSVISVCINYKVCSNTSNNSHKMYTVSGKKVYSLLQL